MNTLPNAYGVVGDVAGRVSDAFRHLWPGILALGAARIAYPTIFAGLDLSSAASVALLAAIAASLGVVLFVVNRYVINQFVDFVFYLFGSRTKSASLPRHVWEYVGFVAQHTVTVAAKSDAGVREHIRFRMGSVFLLWTIAELIGAAARWHSPLSAIAGHSERWWLIGAGAVFGIGLFQAYLAHRIDLTDTPATGTRAGDVNI